MYQQKEKDIGPTLLERYSKVRPSQERRLSPRSIYYMGGSTEDINT